MSLLIESKQNKQFKTWVKLKTKKYRDEYDMFLVYGKHLIEKAKEKNVLIEIITSNPDKNGTLISLDLMKELQQTPSWIDEIGLCKKENQKIDSTRVLVLDDVQDPDNVGALIRSASAFGFTHIILSLQSADLYNEKTIRASKGAIFDCYIERKPLLDALSQLKEENYIVIAADAHATTTIKQDKINKIVLILGNEGHGINEQLLPLIDQSVTIKTTHVESLNVSVAGAILMYEWSV
ncbi:MAG: RNA methyltransferase [Acholeplasmataceae bacterium]